jgi:hypothetical protein
MLKWNHDKYWSYYVLHLSRYTEQGDGVNAEGKNKTRKWRYHLFFYFLFLYVSFKGAISAQEYKPSKVTLISD